MIQGFKNAERRALALILWILALLFAFPIVWMLLTSVKDPIEVFSLTPTFLPRSFNIENYLGPWRQIELGRMFLNSTLVAVGSLLLSLIINAAAGYAFAKMVFPGKGLLFAIVLSAVLIPEQVKLVPMYLIAGRLGMIDNYAGLIIPTVSQTFGVFLMRQYASTIPDELLESARLDGCSEWRILAQVVVPLCKPAFAAIAVFQFLWRWNELLWPLMIVRSQEFYTLQLGLASIKNTLVGAPMMATAVTSVLPVVLLFLMMQRYFVEGIAQTGLKG